ncbi:MAG TPA: class I SAM-dependent methyltransferase [Candidatus Limnocylindria bacterium]|nr:class I SAM-dependent methyltransferase [Candidatus Limnocylindria bacterium]
MLKLSRTLLCCFVLFSATAAQAQERFSFFQASTPESVERMLKLAGLRDDDVVVDLGSGDGLIVLTAARMNPKLRGWGVDIDAKLVNESNQRAKEEGLADRVKFYHINAFDADLREATVITMWMFPEMMRLLRPIILERARPGTRVLSSTWDFSSWQHDEVSSGNPTIHKWIVPARAAGYWSWDFTVDGRRIPYSSIKEQQFQVVEGVVRAGRNREVLEDVKLSGDDISFKLEITLEGLGLTKHEFNGKMRGDQMTGTVKMTPANREPLTLPWRAKRTAKSDYFAPTGTRILNQTTTDH